LICGLSELDRRIINALPQSTEQHAGLVGAGDLDRVIGIGEPFHRFPNADRGAQEGRVDTSVKLLDRAKAGIVQTASENERRLRKSLSEEPSRKNSGLKATARPASPARPEY
jgi:hypothetical protein